MTSDNAYYVRSPRRRGVVLNPPSTPPTETRVNGKRVHACVDCRKLPEWPDDPEQVDVDTEYRPRTPRPAPHGGPNSARCSTHYRAKREREKRRAREDHQRRTYGLTPEMVEAIEREQGGRCPCGADLETATVSTDHDHTLAETHGHARDRGCPACVRGRLCSSCNRQIVGHLSWGGRRSSPEVAAALRALAAYLDDPPARRALAPHLAGGAA